MSFRAAARRQLAEVGPASLSRGLSVLATFLLTVAIARLLGAPSSGAFFLVQSGLAIFATAGRFGTDNLALRLGAGDHHAAGVAAARLLGACTITGLLAAGFGFGAFVLTVNRIPNLPANLAVATASAILPQALCVVAGAILRARGRLVVGTLAEMGSLPVLTLTFIMWTALRANLSLSSAIAALSLASWATAIWAIPAAVLVAKPHTDAWRPGAAIHFVAAHFRQLAAMMGTSLLFYALTWAPIFVLGFTRSPSEVGYYATAARLAAVISLVPTIQISYLAPAFARLYHRRELTRLNGLCNSAAWQAFAIAAPPALGLIALPSLVIRLAYGPDFAEAALPLSLLTVAALVSVGFGQVNQLMLLCDLEDTALLLNLGWLVSWALIGFWCSELGGASGAAVFALGTSLIYVSVASYALARRRGIISFVRRPVQFATARS